jgi:hypothetical protein
MRPNTHDLPAALRDVSERTGLLYMHGLDVPIPVACRKDLYLTPEEAAVLPVQMNFHTAMLDLDKSEDREEYERVMDYHAAGYGMRIIHLERILVTKTKVVNNKRVRHKVRRIYLEYYAPYRVSNK